MNVYVSLVLYAFQGVCSATTHHFCVLCIVAILSLVLVRETAVVIYWYCHNYISGSHPLNYFKYEVFDYGNAT